MFVSNYRLLGIRIVFVSCALHPYLEDSHWRATRRIGEAILQYCLLASMISVPRTDLVVYSRTLLRPKLVPSHYGEPNPSISPTHLLRPMVGIPATPKSPGLSQLSLVPNSLILHSSSHQPQHSRNPRSRSCAQTPNLGPQSFNHVDTHNPFASQHVPLQHRPRTDNILVRSRHNQSVDRPPLQQEFNRPIAPPPLGKNGHWHRGKEV